MMRWLKFFIRPIFFVLPLLLFCAKTSVAANVDSAHRDGDSGSKPFFSEDEIESWKLQLLPGTRRGSVITFPTFENKNHHPRLDLLQRKQWFSCWHSGYEAPELPSEIENIGKYYLISLDTANKYTKSAIAHICRLIITALAHELPSEGEQGIYFTKVAKSLAKDKFAKPSKLGLHAIIWQHRFWLETLLKKNIYEFLLDSGISEESAKKSLENIANASNMTAFLGEDALIEEPDIFNTWLRETLLKERKSDFKPAFLLDEFGRSRHVEEQVSFFQIMLTLSPPAFEEEEEAQQILEEKIQAIHTGYIKDNEDVCIASELRAQFDAAMEKEGGKKIDSWMAAAESQYKKIMFESSEWVKSINDFKRDKFLKSKIFAQLRADKPIRRTWRLSKTFNLQSNTLVAAQPLE